MTTNHKNIVAQFNYLSQLVGYPELKQTLSWLLVSLLKPNARMPRLLFKGAAGGGKTELMEIVAKEIAAMAEARGESVKIFTINPAMTKRQFLEKYMAGEFEGASIVIFLVDEAHAHQHEKSPLWQCIKLLSEAQDVRPVAFSDTESITANPFAHVWLMATNENIADKAIQSRFQEIVVRPPTSEECGMLLDFFLPRYAEGKTVLKEGRAFLLSRVFANPREIRNLIKNEVNIYPEARIDKAQAAELCAHFGRFALGLTAPEVKMLVSLGNNSKGLQVGELAIQAGYQNRNEASEKLREISALGLIVTTTQGRKALSKIGADYLATLAKLQAAAKAKAEGETPKVVEKKSDEKVATSPAKAKKVLAK